MARKSTPLGGIPARASRPLKPVRGNVGGGGSRVKRSAPDGVVRRNNSNLPGSTKQALRRKSTDTRGAKSP